jgi:hypothetical protein
MNTFLDLFSYESITPSDGTLSTSFNNCVILKSFGEYSKGDKVVCINLQITMYLWKNDTDFEEEVVIL